MKMEPIEGSETSAFIKQTPGNYPKGNLLYSVHDESLKSRIQRKELYIFRQHVFKHNTGFKHASTLQEKAFYCILF